MPIPRSSVFVVVDVVAVCSRERCAAICREPHPREGASSGGAGVRYHARDPDNGSRACVDVSASPVVSAYTTDCKYHHRRDQLGNDKSPT